jgi:hypothetical protein
MNGAEKIEKILSELDIKAPTFANNIGVSYQRIFDIQRQKTKKISADIISAIISRYPQYNVQWLFTGEGEMVNKTVNQNNVKGDNMQGHTVTVTKTETERLLDMLELKDMQINKLIGIIEQLNTK